MIEVQNVSKSYGGFVAVSDVSFKVKEGEILGFLGPNGAGKTTTMRIITGYLVPSSGDVFIDGESVFESPIQVKKKIGYLPETAAIYPFYTVNDFLYFVADLKKVPKSKIKERVEYVMVRCGLCDVKNRLIGHLSKGYKQRLGVAQAIVHSPKVLILDEPTVGLDPQQIIEVRNMIRELKENHTIILSSHILPEVSMVCDRVVIINKGKVAVEDMTRNIENRAFNSRQVYVETTKELSDNMLSEFLKVRGVVSANREGKGVLLEIGKNERIRNDVAKFVVEKKWGLLEMSLRRFTLEDVFMEVVSKGGEK